MSTLRCVMLVMLVACDSSDAETAAETSTPCGEELTCGEGEFCLARIPSGGSTGDEVYSCEILPDGCADFDAMCFDEPGCAPDWADDFCPGSIGSGCSTVFGEEAYCQD